jgi:predicted nucleic acid-binding protein
VICVDTSVWIEALRGPATVAAFHLGELLETDEVLLPAPVRLELLLGVSSQDRAMLEARFAALDPLVPAAASWQQAERWVADASTAGERFGVVDLLIAATAAEHGATVWSRDAAFERMAQLGFVELYAAP